MSKSTFSKSGLIAKALIAIVMVMTGMIGTHAQELPVFMMYHPSIGGEVKANTTMYLYFKGGTKATELKAKVYQNDSEVGELVYKSSNNKPNAVISVDKAIVAEFIKKLTMGKFDVKPYNISFPDADGNIVTVDLEDGTYPTATYSYAGAAGKVVSEKKLPNNVLKSWIPMDASDEEGVMSISFDKAISTGAKVELEYGNAENPKNGYFERMGYTLSDDAKTMYIDFRGKLRSVSKMVPEGLFLDDSGNPTDPPSTISLHISQLYAIDGTSIDSYLEGTNKLINAQVHYILRYKDLSFATPTISDVNVGDNAMLTITLANGGSLLTTDVVVSDANDIELCRINEASVRNGIISVNLPENVTGDDICRIKLVNAKYNAEDGNEHDIAVYDIKSVVKPNAVTTIADIKEFNAPTKFELNCTDVKVTFSNAESGFIFVEDATGAIQINPDETHALTQGKTLSGKIVGTYLNDEAKTIVIDFENSDFEEKDTDIEPTELGALHELSNPFYNCRLVKINVSEDIAVEYDGDNDGYFLMSAEPLFAVSVVLSFMSDYDMFEPSDHLASITGIAYLYPGLDDQYMIVPRSTDDVEKKTSAIESVIGDANADAPVYSISGVKVREAGESIEGLAKGVYIVGGRKVFVK